MNEIRRLGYLQALGIDSYVSRRQLPAAAPTRRVGLRRADAAPARGQPEQVTSRSPGPRKPRPPAVPATPATSGPAAKSTVVAAEAGTGPVFSVLACHLGGWYWLDEIPRGREPGPNYLRLLQSIGAALELPTAEPLLERFDWPIAPNPRLDTTEAAARDGFSGFLGGRLERNPVAGLVLLGVANEFWLDRDALGSRFGIAQLVETVSAWKMLRQPELKKQAWKDLQGLRRHLPQ